MSGEAVQEVGEPLGLSRVKRGNGLRSLVLPNAEPDVLGARQVDRCSKPTVAELFCPNEVLDDLDAESRAALGTEPEIFVILPTATRTRPHQSAPLTTR
jgi:hypothetical protein